MRNNVTFAGPEDICGVGTGGFRVCGRRLLDLAREVLLAEELIL